MKNKLVLHHFSKSIARNSLEFVLELFSKLGCETCFVSSGKTWAVVKQKGQNAAIQLIETRRKPLASSEKTNSHIAFLAENPGKEMNRMRKFVLSKKRKFVQGSWSEKELYFDCPNDFVDFVIEILHSSAVV